MPRITWTEDLKRSLPRSVRTSWEAHLFLPGERVTLDRQSGVVPPDALEQITGHGGADAEQPTSNQLFTVQETLVRPGASGRASDLRGFYRLVGWPGLWSHAWFVDPRPMRYVYGAIVSSADARLEDHRSDGGRCLVALLAGSTCRRDPGQPLPIQLEPTLERRARMALKTSHVAGLCPIVGEFLVALTSATTGALYAALWHSPLDSLEQLSARAMLSTGDWRGSVPVSSNSLR